MRAILLRGLMTPLNLTERERQTGHLRAGVLNVDAKRPRVTSKGEAKGALNASRSGLEVGFPLLCAGIRLARG